MRRLLPFLIGAAIGAGAAGGVVALTRGTPHHPPLRVLVGGKSEIVSSGTTFGQVVQRFHLEPRTGDLLDVHSKLLRVGAIHGTILLDGAPAESSTILRGGDRIVVDDGHTRREPIRKQPLAGLTAVPDDPQFTLTRRPGQEIITTGAVSHQIASIAFVRRSGAAVEPRAVALTFDDGPSPEYTPGILAVLRRFHVQATFFLVGYLTDQYPQLVHSELRAGMTIGNHTYNHPEVPPFANLPSQLVAAEIDLGAQPLERLGIEPRLFRPPGGSFSPQLVAAAEARGERIVLWSVDPRDWQPGTTPQQVARNVLSAVRPGSIIILHDGGGDRSATVRALPKIIKAIRRRGLRFVAVTAS
jgi:peptidoglycan/xylan/chitin deacetylase (PgdA/CDA1 family)